MAEETICSRCGYAYVPDESYTELAVYCPRCLAAFLAKDATPPESDIETQPMEYGTLLKPGTTFAGYEILEILGKGGMGVVYKARQLSLGRQVALKILAPRFAASEEFSRRFDQEARVLASVNHPNVVQVFDSGRDGGTPFLVMEYVEGKTLEDVIDKERPLDLPRFLTLLRDVCRGLHSVHQAGLIHRDLKPANILIDTAGTPKLSDFGLTIETDRNQKMTESGMLVGTPHYVSPEQIEGKEIDRRADLYALGIILFQGIAGHPPFHGPTPSATLLKHVNDPPPSLGKIAPDCPRSAQEIVRKLLSKDPGGRHDSAAALEADLSLALREAKTVRRTGVKPTAPRRRLFPLVAAAALLLLAVAAFFIARSPNSSPEARLRAALERAVLFVERDAYDEADQALEEAEALEQAGETLEIAEIRSLRERIPIFRSEFTKIPFGEDVDESQYGAFLAFVKGRWDEALPLLAGSHTSPLAPIAKLDLARPSTPAAQIELADRWYDLGSKEESGIRTQRIWERAYAWYDRAIQSAPGEAPKHAVTRLAHLERLLEARQEIDLLRILNPGKFALRGTFRVEQGALLTPADTELARMEIPYLTPDEYDLSIDVERRSGRGILYLGLVKGLHHVGLRFDPARRTVSPLDGIPMSVTAQTTRASGPLSLLVRVRKQSIRIDVDGARAATIPWKAAYDRDRVDAGWEVSTPGVLFLGSQRSRYRISRLALTPVPGLDPPSRVPRLPRHVAPPRPVDLLALVDPARDGVKSEWFRVGKGIACQPGDPALLRIPYTPPDEYDLTAVVERRVGNEAICLGLVKGRSQFYVMVNGWARKGGYSGLALLDGKALPENPFSVRGKVIENNRPSVVTVSVRNSGVTAAVDGKTIVDWAGAFDRLSTHPKFAMKELDSLFIGSWSSRYDISRYTLTPISGAGRKVERAPAPGGALSGPVDLLPLIHPGRDGVKGEFGIDEGALVTPHGVPFARVEVPVEPPLEYDIELLAERQTGTNGLVVGLAADGVPFMVYLDGRIGRGIAYSGLDSASGRRFHDNETTHEGEILPLGRPTRITFAVRQSGIRAAADGRILFDWKGDSRRLSVRPDWRVRRNGILFLGSYESRFRITEARLVPRASGLRILGRSPEHAPVSGEPVDLLAKIDAEKDAIVGLFERKGKTLLTPHRTPWARLQVVADWPDEYDLRLRVVRRDGENSLNLAPRWQGRPCAVMIDAHGPTQHDVTGLDFIDKKEFFRNETTTQGPFLLLGRESTVVVSIRKESLGVTIDGRRLFTWRGDPRRLSIAPGLKVPDPKGLALGCYESRFEIREFTLVPRTEAKPASARIPDPIPAGGRDLLASVDPDRHAVGGIWKRTAEGILSDETTYARLRLPYDPPEEYDFTVVFRRVSGESDVSQILSHQGRQFLWVMGSSNGRHGLAKVRGAGLYGDPKNPTIWDGPPLGKGVHTSRVEVRKDGVRAYLDGRRIVDFRTDYSDVTLEKGWSLARPNALGLATYKSPTVFLKAEVREVTGRGRSAEREFGRVPKDASIDLLRRIDVEKDAVKGAWLRDGDRLLTPDVRFGRLQIPYVPPAEYDLTLEVERLGPPQSLYIGLVAEGRQFTLISDGFGGGWTTFDILDRRSTYREGYNETAYRRPVFAPDKVRTFVCSVRKGRITVSVDGRTIIDWKGDVSRLSLQQDLAVPEPAALFLGSHLTVYRIRRLDVREVSGAGKPLRIMEKTRSGSKR